MIDFNHYINKIQEFLWFSVQEEEVWTVKYICPIVQFERQTLVSLQHISYSKLAVNVVICRIGILGYNQLSFLCLFLGIL